MRYVISAWSSTAMAVLIATRYFALVKGFLY